MKSVRPIYLDKLIRTADEFDVDHRVMDAIIQVESSWMLWAVRFEPDFRHVKTPEKYAKENNITVDTEIMNQMMSWGLGQLMGGTARDLGFEQPLPLLLDPYWNINLCCKLFQKICRRYDVLTDRIAAYNSGSPVTLASGKYKNQKYVDKVLEALGH